MSPFLTDEVIPELSPRQGKTYSQTEEADGSKQGNLSL